MFILAAVFISGKQGNAEYKQGVSDLASQIQQVINDVGNGQYPYPSSGDLTCAPSTSPGGLTFGTGGNGQGTNGGCVFLGQVLQLAPQDNNGTPNPNPNLIYDVYTVAGNRCSDASSTCTSNNLSTDFTDARPTAVYSGVNLTEHKTLEWGTTVTAMYSGSTPINGVGFFGSFSGFGNYANSGTLSSSSQDVGVAVIPSATLVQSESWMVGQIANISSTTSQPDVTICLANGNHKASVTIGGGNGQRLTVEAETGNVASVC